MFKSDVFKCNRDTTYLYHSLSLHVSQNWYFRCIFQYTKGIPLVFPYTKQLNQSVASGQSSVNMNLQSRRFLFISWIHDARCTCYCRLWDLWWFDFLCTLINITTRNQAQFFKILYFLFGHSK